jgi:hypothetical protein
MRVVLSTYDSRGVEPRGTRGAVAGPELAPETGTRANAMAGKIRTDGAAVAATLLMDAISRD